MLKAFGSPDLANHQTSEFAAELVDGRLSRILFDDLMKTHRRPTDANLSMVEMSFLVGATKVSATEKLVNVLALADHFRRTSSRMLPR